MTVTDQRPAAEIGQARRRKEDARLITGRTMWTENITLPGMLHVAILRSPVAHARITHLNLEPARQLPNVVAVFSGRDFAEEAPTCPCAWPATDETKMPNHPPLAVDEVRHTGEGIAVVVARDRATAMDALEAIEIEFDELPVVLDLEEAIAENAPLVHSDIGTNLSYTWVFDSAEAGTGGNVAEALESSDVRLKRRFIQQRLIPAYMEPRSVVVDPTGDQFTIWSATQIPHVVRVLLAMSTGIPENKLRVVAPDVGGGFGGKLQVTPEELTMLLVARRLGKPVKYTETRSESMQATHHGRAQIQDIEIGATRDGTVTGLRVKLLADMGAYLSLLGPGIPLLGAYMYNGIYKFPAYRFECRGVFTNKAWTDAYRGAGRPEATFAIERIMDELAAELDMDPMELRRRNWIRHEEFPFRTVSGLEYDTGNYEAATDKAMRMFGYDELRREQEERRRRKDPVQLGIGISTYTEMCGLAPSRWLGEMKYGAGGWEAASIRVLPTGKVEVLIGTSPHGQGHVTSFSQIVADKLGVPFENIEVLHGDTRISNKGLDTYGSRSLAVGGAALVQACEKVLEKSRKVAAFLLEANEDDLEFTDGAWRVRGTPGEGKTIADCALAVFTSHTLPHTIEPNLDAEATYDPETFSFPHGTHLCAVEVDTETGWVHVRKYVAVDDVGKVINPQIVEGQIHGGITQGLSQALFEEAVYDADGNLMTGTFVDYTLPTAADLPEYQVDRTETPATTHPLGAKGVGEAGTIAATPAVVNAIVDALRPMGVTDIRMPCTPERVWQAIQEATRGKETAEQAQGGGAA